MERSTSCPPKESKFSTWALGDSSGRACGQLSRSRDTQSGQVHRDSGRECSRGGQGGRMQLQPINKTWAAVAKLFHPLVAASQLHPVDVAQPEHNQYTLWTFEDIKCRESLPLCTSMCTKVLCRRSTAAASDRRCSVVAPAASPAHKAQLTTALMAQGWCHESVDIATAQGAVQQLRAHLCGPASHPRTTRDWTGTRAQALPGNWLHGTGGDLSAEKILKYKPLSQHTGTTRAPKEFLAQTFVRGCRPHAPAHPR